MSTYTVGFGQHDANVREDTKFRSESIDDCYRYCEIFFGEVFNVSENAHVSELVTMIRDNKIPIPTFPHLVNEWEGDSLKLKGMKFFPAGIDKTLSLVEGDLYLYDYAFHDCVREGDQLESRVVRKVSELLGRCVHIGRGVSQWQNAEAVTRNIRLATKLAEQGLIKVKSASRYNCWFDSNTMSLNETHGLVMDVPGVWITQSGFSVRGGEAAKDRFWR